MSPVSRRCKLKRYPGRQRRLNIIEETGKKPLHLKVGFKIIITPIFQSSYIMFYLPDTIVFCHFFSGNWVRYLGMIPRILAAGRLRTVGAQGAGHGRGRKSLLPDDSSCTAQEVRVIYYVSALGMSRSMRCSWDFIGFHEICNDK